MRWCPTIATLDIVGAGVAEKESADESTLEAFLILNSVIFRCAKVPPGFMGM